jgi:hypothetical protein
MDDRTAAQLQSIVSTAFVGTWITLAIVGIVANRRMDIAAKRRWWPRWTILTGAFFVFFTTSLVVLGARSWSSLSILFVVVPAVVLICYLNIKFTRFCEKCGTTQYNSNWFSRMRFCSRCGAELDTAKPSQHDKRFEQAAELIADPTPPVG